MDIGLLIVLGVAAVIGIPVAVVYLLISNQSLKKRVDALEAAATSRPANPWAAAKAATPPAPVAPRAPEQSPVPAESADVARASVASSQTAPAQGPPKSVILNRQRLAALTTWLTQNWFYVVSAVSLALAGIFLVQYSIEQGLLPPWARVMAALAFGAALVAVGEFIRRRYGDSEDASTAYLPSTFSSAGIVTLFGGVLSARALYGLIGPEVAMIGMSGVGVLALVLGWFYGPLLAGIGVAGAMLTPFLVGGASDDPSWLFLYFAIVTFVGLAIDTVRRWAWVSMLALGAGFLAGFTLWSAEPRATEPYFILYCAVLAIMAIGVPSRRLLPDHGGAPMSMTIFARKGLKTWPEFPTRLAGGALLTATVLIFLAAFESNRADVFWVAILSLTVLTIAMIVWARNAPAIADLTALPAGALVIVTVGGWRLWQRAAVAAAEPEADMPLMVTGLVAIGVLISVLAAWRSLARAPASVFFAAGAALMAPAMAIAIEVFWDPRETLGAYVWALHALAIAALMVAMAERFARVDGPNDRLRMSFAVLSTLAALAFATTIMFSSAALTVALTVTVVAAAWLDRRFNLPLMGIYILVGVATIGFRLVAWPGLDWAEDAPIWEVLLSYGGALAGFVAAWWLCRAAGRTRSTILLETAIFSTTGLLLSILLFRGINVLTASNGNDTHWSFGLAATIWLALGLAQIKRLDMGGTLRVLRIGLGTLFLLIGALLLAVALIPFNPLLGWARSSVSGPPLINTLMAAYLFPALVLLFGAKWLAARPKWLRGGLVGAGGLLAIFWLGLVIRHFWRGGDDMELPGIEQPELWSYTVVLLIAGAALFYTSLARQSPLLRKIGLAVIGLAVAKVFLIDIAGLGGLIRIFALLLLGLSLAGLAWLNRWASGQGNSPPRPQEPTET